MTILELDSPDAIWPLVRCLTRYLAEQPAELVERPAQVTFAHDPDGRLVSVVVTLDE